MNYYKNLYSFYRSLGTKNLQSILSTFLKPFLHYFLYKRPIFSLYYASFFKNKYNYSKGFWFSFHFGVQHLRPLIINKNCIYLRGNKTDFFSQLTNKMNTPVKFIYVDEYQNKFLNLINNIKDENIILATIDGSFGEKNDSLTISEYIFKYNKNLIDLGIRLKKEIFFEIYYMNNFFQIKRKYILLDSQNYKKEIKNLLLSIIKKYPHNIREYSFIKDNK